MRQFICLREHTRIRPRRTAAIRGVLVDADVDVVFLAGYMKKTGTTGTQNFEGQNPQHSPRPLLRIGGPGMYGDRVFLKAVLEAGEPESGVSIHLVDAAYDTGAVVSQCRVAVFRGDSLDDSKARYGHERRSSWSKRLGKLPKVKSVSLQSSENFLTALSGGVFYCDPAASTTTSSNWRAWRRQVPAFSLR